MKRIDLPQYLQHLLGSQPPRSQDYHRHPPLQQVLPVAGFPAADPAVGPGSQFALQLYVRFRNPAAAPLLSHRF